MPALMGFASFAVDVGRMQLTKVELQNALDAAARYGVTGLSDNSAASKAVSAAAQNRVLNRAMTLSAADVVSGRYDDATRLFTPGGTPSNAEQRRADP